MDRDALLSDCRRYRYSLYRVWDHFLPKVLFIGLNPSTADENDDDPTIRRCIGFARSWGYGGIFVGNLFAFRATRPEDMLSAKDPVGPMNDQTLLAMSGLCGMTVAAWGKHGSFMDRGNIVHKMMPVMSALKLNKDGSPSHPLYLPKSLKPVAWHV